jgi:mannose-6-phosphate isomerase-like protein (cupin superfamily)
MSKQIRRVVTGHDERGRAVVLSDGPAPFVHVNKLNPDWFSIDLWRTHETPAKIVSRAEEPTAGPRRQMPTKNGTVLRINHFPPETETVRTMTPADSLRVFEGLGNPAAATFGKGGRHPLMHRTETIDYAIVLSGQITMVMDDEDVHLEAGDIVIQCGTNHAWSNRSKEPCMVAFILIDGDFDQNLEAKFETAMLPRS